jgi:ankyrin repeat protein
LYAARHLGDHLNLLAPDDALFEQVYSFISCKPLSKSYIQSLKAAQFLDPTGHDFSRVPTDMNPLHIAAIMGNLAIIQLTLRRQPDLLDVPDISGVTAVWWAVIFGHEDVVEELLNANANSKWVNDVYEKGLLNYAARSRFDGIVRLLVQYHISYHKPAGILTKKEVRSRELLLAVRKGDDVSVQQILEEDNVNVDIRDSDGGTPLQWAAWYDYTKIVEQLLDRGGDINARDLTSGRTALHEAAEQGCYDTLKLLLDKGANIEAISFRGITPLHRAAGQGGCEVTKLLLSYGANIDAETNGFGTALHLACQFGQLDTIRLLIARGINTDKFTINDVRLEPNISESLRESVQTLIRTLIPSPSIVVLS